MRNIFPAILNSHFLDFNLSLKSTKISMGSYRHPKSGGFTKNTPPSNRFWVFEGGEYLIENSMILLKGGVFLEKILSENAQFWKPIYLFFFCISDVHKLKKIKICGYTAPNIHKYSIILTKNKYIVKKCIITGRILKNMLINITHKWKYNYSKNFRMGSLLWKV